MSAMKRGAGVWLWGWLVVLCFAAGTLRAQAPAGSCTPSKGGYACDLRVFKQVLARSRTMAVKASPRDRVTQTQLSALAKSLGKAVAEEGGTGDLIVEVLPADSAGVFIGPGGSDLAVLRVTDGKTGALEWVETYNGSAEMPWPAVVHAVIVQFEKRLKG